jgi:hypothetical protein
MIQELYTRTVPACPNCRSAQVCEPDDHNIIERIVFYFVKLYPFLCRACHRRFYLFLPETGMPGQESARM